MPRIGPARAIMSIVALLLLAGGCTSPVQYVRNGFKVGPNYATPPAQVAPHWIDSVDVRVRCVQDDPGAWWTVFEDPLLNRLIQDAYRQNLTLREAGFRILAARAQKNIAIGEIFPQQQDATGAYTRFGVGQNFFDSWNFGFNMNWELDFWGRFRRAIAAAQDNLDASVFNYDDVLVTLLGDMAQNYVQIRTSQERIRLLKRVVKIQQNVLTFIETQLKVGFKGVTEIDRAQAESNLKQSLAQIANLEIDVRVAENRLCTLMGIPAQDIEAVLSSAPNTSIPVTPDSVIVGIPADLLRRRPDVRRAERLAAAQGELIGIAESDLYPSFFVSGTLGWQAQKLEDLLTPQGFNSNVGPSFQWNLLNYGRIVNNVRLQDANFQVLVTTYQQTVLQADEEVEDGIVTFLKGQQRAKLLRESVQAAYTALEVVLAQYQQGVAGADFNRYAVIEQNLVNQQDLWAQSRGQVAQGLIQTYRALGGGWQMRLSPQDGNLEPAPAGAAGAAPEAVAPPRNLPPVPQPAQGPELVAPPRNRE
ncbi:MAG: TolC family protein [Planctomycetia bacterium]|nr:TolC family protein [Planctomycetia bacterium]